MATTIFARPGSVVDDTKLARIATRARHRQRAALETGGDAVIAQLWGDIAHAAEVLAGKVSR